jgi:hypothetical protein
VKILTVSHRVEPILNDREAPSRFPGVDLILSCGDVISTQSLIPSMSKIKSV